MKGREGKLRVVFDASELGGLSYTGVRGVRRVIHNFAARLPLYENLEVSYTGLSLPDEQRFRSECPGGCPIRVIPSRMPEMAGTLAEAATNFVQSSISNPSLPYKITRRALFHFANAVRSWGRVVPSGALRSADVFHSPFGPLPRRLRRFSGVAAFVTIYDLIPILHPHLVDARSIEMLRMTVRSLPREVWITCISQSVKEDICNVLGFPSERVFVVPLAASSEIFQPKDSASTSEAQRRYGIGEFPYFLSLSAIEVRKNLLHLIRSFASLLETGRAGNLRLVLVGKRFQASSSLDAIIEKDDRLKERVIFTGFVPDDDLAAIYSGAVAFVFPSLAEGFGLPPLEAMQCGLPVICSNTTSLPEVVGDAGILLDPNDEMAWCDAMLKVYSDCELRDHLRLRSFARSQRFTWEASVNSLVTAYEFAVATKRRQSFS